MSTILVQFGEPQWTMRAMHLACAMARSNDAQHVTLLVLMRAPNPFLLGADIGMAQPTANELDTLNDCAQIAGEYGLALTVQPMQYDTLGGAIAQAAEECEVAVAFVQWPHSRVPFADRLGIWNLNRQLQTRGCKLAMLDKPGQAESWMPSVSLKATH